MRNIKAKVIASTQIEEFEQKVGEFLSGEVSVNQMHYSTSPYGQQGMYMSVIIIYTDSKPVRVTSE